MRMPISPARLTAGWMIALLLAVPAVMAAESAEEKKEANVVARVGSEVVTQQEYERALRSVSEARARRASAMGQPAPGFMTEEEQKQVLDGMIDARVLSILAEDTDEEIPAEVISGRIQAFKSRFPSEEAFEKSLEEQGLTVAELADRIRDQMRVQKFVRDNTEHITATEDEVAAEYEKRKNQGLLDTVDVSHILIKVLSSDEEVWEEAKKRIDAARERIVNGEDFAEVAKEVSEDPGSAKNGGLFPNTPRGKMTPEFERVAFTIPIGELSEPFRTEYGWHILKVSGRGAVSLEDAAPRIAKDLTRQKRRDTLKQMVEEAKKDLTIEIDLPQSAPEALNADIPLPEQAS